MLCGIGVKHGDIVGITLDCDENFVQFHSNGKPQAKVRLKKGQIYFPVMGSGTEGYPHYEVLYDN